MTDHQTAIDLAAKTGTRLETQERDGETRVLYLQEDGHKRTYILANIIDKLRAKANEMERQGIDAPIEYAKLYDRAGTCIGGRTLLGFAWMSCETLDHYRKTAICAGDRESAAIFAAAYDAREPLEGCQHTSEGTKTALTASSDPQQADIEATALCNTLYGALDGMNVAAVKLAADGKTEAARLMAEWLPESIMGALRNLVGEA